MNVANFENKNCLLKIDHWENNLKSKFYIHAAALSNSFVDFQKYIY
jgi:hypothetical protein